MLYFNSRSNSLPKRSITRPRYSLKLLSTVAYAAANATLRLRKILLEATIAVIDKPPRITAGAYNLANSTPV